jgi:hypothetical protein
LGVEKSSPKIWHICVIFTENNYPVDKNSPNLVTLLLINSTLGKTLPDFSWRDKLKGGHIPMYVYQTTKNTNGNKIDQHMYYIARPSKIYPNWDFGFQDMPSGNPALQSTC